MKIFKLPRSQMSAIKDRCVCVPVDHQTISNTLNMLPRTPNQAGLVPVKLKRKQNMKNVHLQEYINPQKLIKALESLRALGNKFYQFSFSSSEDFKERCLRDDTGGFETLYRDTENDSASSISSDDMDVEIDKNLLSSDDHSKESDNGDDIEKEKPEKSRSEVIQDEIIEREDEEEHYLKNDATGKYMFEYNRTTCLSDDVPEIGIPDTPITISPGEGKYFILESSGKLLQKIFIIDKLIN